MLVYNGKISLYCFLMSSAISAVIVLPHLYPPTTCLLENLYLLVSVYFTLINVFLLVCFRGFTYQVALRAGFLGFIFAGGLFIAILGPRSWQVFGWYMCLMAFFHFSEFFMIALTNPRTLSVDSFILNHSKEYCIAAVASWVEFFLEHWFFPGSSMVLMKKIWILLLKTEKPLLLPKNKLQRKEGTLESYKPPP